MRQKNSRVTPNAVFLNIPYDQGFHSLYLSYIVGLVHLGFKPRATLGLPEGINRLDKILEVIQGCHYSIHDLSRVELDRKPPFHTPRFNMPFELGLAATWAKLHPAMHSLFVFESKSYRVQKSLSDLNGIDPHIHDGQVKGIMRELCNAFVRPQNQPKVPEMIDTYNIVSRQLPKILEDAGAESVFEARAFQDICFVTKGITEKLKLPK